MQQNTSIGSKSASKPLQNVAESARETTEQVFSDLGTKTNRMAGEASEAASQYYTRASSWIQQNYGKTLGMIGFFAAVGTIGYFIGRNNSRSDIKQLSQRT